MDVKYSNVGIKKYPSYFISVHPLKEHIKGDNIYEQFLFNRCDDFQSKRKIWC